MNQKVVILSTGDELTTGKVVDTNSATIADRLFSIGLQVVAVLKVGDDREKLLWALDQARELGDFIIGTGGLGPTADDLTTETVATLLGCKLDQDEEVAAALKKRFESRGLAWTLNNLKQAQFPHGAVIIPNPAGTAPGFRVSVGRNKTLIWLSGVPQEMFRMLQETVIPWIAQQAGGQQHFMSCTFKIYGLTESKLDEMLKPLNTGPAAKLSFRAHYPDLSLRLTVSGSPQQESLFIELRRQISAILGTHVYAQSDVALEEVVGQMLLERHHSLALAESCTGGYISRRITRIAGSSAYYYGGAITYSNDAKIRFLGVKPETLKKHGAVSRETALEMSRGIRDKTGASIGFSVTGIAGPAGGTPDKPVGTVWMSIDCDHCHEARLFQFHGDRERVIVGASQAALYWLRNQLLASRD
ncbi:MAG: competence/damage-inducible protein A [Alphaproteobacteria bacterium]